MTKTRDILGMAMIGQAAHEPLLALTDADFDSYTERVVASVIRGMIHDGSAIDFTTVSARVDATGQAPMLSTSELYGWTSGLVPTMAGEYARLIRDETRVRLTRHVTDSVQQKLVGPEATADLSEILAWQQREIAALPLPYGEDEKDWTVDALMREPEEPAEWIVPGLIARLDRIVLTGHEGHGKSVLLRQLAACLAAGVHPWSRQRSHEPARVLHVDVENSRPQTRRGYRMVHSIGQCLPNGWQKNVTVRIRPAGIDAPGRDAGWLNQVASECSPDVIIIGPAYKLMLGDPQKDRDVLALLAALDDVRVRHNAALIIEHHSPHGTGDGPRTVRPYGSSVWQRWPEVGIGLREHKRDEADEYIRIEAEKRTGRAAPIDWLDVVRWRPPREPRDWPTQIQWGAVGEMPWKPAEGYTTTLQIEGAAA